MLSILCGFPLRQQYRWSIWISGIMKEWFMYACMQATPKEAYWSSHKVGCQSVSLKQTKHMPLLHTVKVNLQL